MKMAATKLLTDARKQSLMTKLVNADASNTSWRDVIKMFNTKGLGSKEPLYIEKKN